ncbi:MAG: YidC/Oxa1 family membrane protein insertase [Treponema sp.]|nr:YidC/Oxa1 family membrane protein insertase [Treponema sp.]MCL2250392.1 YidC/Oxa1 family membrane protein insertase [Treponema sp.]
MLSFFYNLFIFPISQLLDICFVFFYRLINNYGFAIFGVSLAFSIFTLPFYFIAEKLQKAERDIQNRMKPKLDMFNSVFKGDEKYMIISTFYRQNNYHPIYAMRSSLGLLIQIPFFIAAYSYISHMELLNGVSFFFIKDLANPDNILSINNFNINILPIFMTFINILSGIIYSKGFNKKDKIQLYIISLLFLILLYNSPSALVLYWTLNNIFSLVKNILQKINNPKKIIYLSILFFILAADIYLLFFHAGDLPKRVLAILFLSGILLLPLFQKLYLSEKIQTFIKNKASNNKSLFFYIYSCIILFLFYGFIIPSSLIASSVAEFSFIDSYKTPFPIIFTVIQQSAGFFLIWPLIIYYLSSKNIRLILSYFMVIIAFISIFNVFTITENFGFFTTTMVLSEPKPFHLIPNLYILNTVFICLLVVFIFIISIYCKNIILISCQLIIIFALTIFSVINFTKINNNFLIVKNQQENIHSDNLISEYTFSKTGKNILIIMLDSAVGSLVPVIFDEKPELYDIMSGFTYFPNCVSFSNHTLIGALPVFGGYEYTPTSINSRNNELLIDKQQEAYLLLPKLFKDAGYSVTITDPPFDNFMMSNLSIFSSYPEIEVKNLIGKYTARWLQDHKEIETISISELLKNKLFRFSFFKSAPLILRLFIYDEGDWFSFIGNSKNKISNSILNDYAFLDTLSKITSFSDTGNTFISIYSHLPHDGIFFQAPDYIPSKLVTNKGTSSFANDSPYHVTIASFLLLSKWFNYLKENNVYDNTKIIIVADHGKGSLNIKDNFRLPNNDLLFGYNPLLMVKDYNSDTTLIRNDDFMTNGDVPLLALEGNINNPVNPFTKNILNTDKENGVNIATIGAVSTYRHNKYAYNINKDQWLYVKENIFELNNWKIISNTESFK